MQRVLIIKLSALGDFVLSIGPMQAIRAAHPEAALTLLTTKGLAGLAEATGLFEAIWLDERPKLWRPDRVLALRHRLRAGRFDRVYDLQTSRRTDSYYRLFWPGPWPEWSGTAPGCSHPDTNPERGRQHPVETQRGQLAAAGIADVPLSDLSCWQSDISGLNLPADYAVLLPGGAPHRPEKRWPAGRFAELAVRLAETGLTPAVVGGPPETEAARAISAVCPQALDIVGRTSLLDLATVMRGARLVVGNDTGPMHIASLCGSPCVVLFGPDSRPVLSRPRAHPGGPEPVILDAANLADLPVDTVWRAVPASAIPRPGDEQPNPEAGQAD
ncbi:MAG: glycosyltransferase family 9 protein [Alphaproteobacteria bacterium]|nr:glycosyltransferase family 9 protein [Alphaproteobacteria bacterium]MCB9929546.1 glycosyltransferase family 9 protein [Alphaproteobacteria bacterium]